MTTSGRDLLAAGDALLAHVVSVNIALVDLAVVPSLEVFRDRGATFRPPDPDEETEDESVPGPVLNRADVDLLAVVKEAVAHLGFRIGEEKDGFVQLIKDSFPAECAVYFLRSSIVPPYAIVPVAKCPLVVVVHVADIADDRYNQFAHPLGVHVVRLRDLAALDVSALLPVVAAVRGAVPPIDGVPVVPSRPARLELSKVDEYARTQQSAEFESAASEIMARLVSFPMRLGDALRGRPVPDGIFVESGEAVLTDCKSKKSDEYGLKSDDADQQARYVDVLRRLEAATPPIKGRGILLFTPAVDVATFETQTRKEFWAKLSAEGRQLLVIPATGLARLHALTHAEGVAFGGFFNKAAFWKALIDKELPGLRGEAEVSALLGDPRLRLRLVGTDVLELAWLAGIVRKEVTADVIGDAMQATDPDALIRDKLRRPLILQGFYAALSSRDASIDSIAAATGLGDAPTRYLVLHDVVGNANAEEFRDHGSSNLLRLRRLLRAS